MDGCFSFDEIKSLQQLLVPANEDSETDDDSPLARSRKSSPGNIGAESNKGSAPHAGPHAVLKGDGDNIWHPSAIVAKLPAEVLDPRQVPEYEIKFKQTVTTEDVFLGINCKTPGTASCEWLSIFVKLPGEILEKIELSVESELVDIRSPRYRLHLPTPHSVDPRTSTAKWHSDTSTLEITLRLSREMDFVNF